MGSLHYLPSIKSWKMIEWISLTLCITTNVGHDSRSLQPRLYSYKQKFFSRLSSTSASKYMLKVINRNAIKRYVICSKLTIHTPERRQWYRSGVFSVTFEHISHLFFVFLVLRAYICLLGLCYSNLYNMTAILPYKKLFHKKQ